MVEMVEYTCLVCLSELYDRFHHSLCLQFLLPYVLTGHSLHQDLSFHLNLLLEADSHDLGLGLVC